MFVCCVLGANNDVARFTLLLRRLQSRHLSRLYPRGRVKKSHTLATLVTMLATTMMSPTTSGRTRRDGCTASVRRSVFASDFCCFSLFCVVSFVLSRVLSSSSSCGSLPQSSSLKRQAESRVPIASCAIQSETSHLCFGGCCRCCGDFGLAVKRPSLDGSGARLSAQVLIGCVESSEVFCRKLIVVARL